MVAKKVTKSKVAPKTKKVLSIALRLMQEFDLVESGEFIRFEDGPEFIDKEILDLLNKYTVQDGPPIIVDHVHTTSFMRNPLRYIPQMISKCNITKAQKKARMDKVNKIVKEAMNDDPLTTVLSIINSVARITRF